MDRHGDDRNWHTTNGGGLPFRPPTVDEALSYSPFTSIMPFSPG
jgi:cohesin loading factor subunit SCC2